MKRKYSEAAANKQTMREGYQAQDDALQSLAEQARDLRMGYEPDDKPDRIWVGIEDAHP